MEYSKFSMKRGANGNSLLATYTNCLLPKKTCQTAGLIDAKVYKAYYKLLNTQEYAV